VSGQVFTFVPANPNTGPATLNIDGVGQRSILNMGSALSGAELQNYKSALVFFNGNANAFDLVNGTPYVKGPNIPAAATLNLDGTSGDYSQVDGIATITAMTLSPGRQKLLEFTSSPQLSNSATLILGSNIVPAPGDVMSFRGETGGVVRMATQLVSGPRYLSNALGANVTLNNTANFFDGPTVSNPLGGMWLVSATITIATLNTSSNFIIKLWDGFNVFASTTLNAFTAATISFPITLSGVCTNARGNIRISVRDTVNTTSIIEANLTGFGNDSVISAVRIG
jgi:hypothetical protein